MRLDNKQQHSLSVLPQESRHSDSELQNQLRKCSLQFPASEQSPIAWQDARGSVLRCAYRNHQNSSFGKRLSRYNYKHSTIRFSKQIQVKKFRYGPLLKPSWEQCQSCDKASLNTLSIAPKCYSDDFWFGFSKLEK